MAIKVHRTHYGHIPKVLCPKCLDQCKPTNYIPTTGYDPLTRQFKCPTCGQEQYILWEEK